MLSRIFTSQQQRIEQTKGNAKEANPCPGYRIYNIAAAQQVHDANHYIRCQVQEALTVELNNGAAFHFRIASLCSITGKAGNRVHAGSSVACYGLSWFPHPMIIPP